MIKKGVLIFLMFLLAVSFASALGISPGKKIIGFEPNLETEIEVYALNMDDEPIRVRVYLNLFLRLL